MALIGRSGNKWYCPKGNLCFTLKICLSPCLFEVNLIKLGCWLQHILAITLVETLKLYFGSTANFYIKWPNDILYEDKKIAGILVAIQNWDSENLEALISFGLNYNNSAPYLCLSDISKILKKDLISEEYFISNLLYGLEKYLKPFIKNDGIDVQSYASKELNELHTSDAYFEFILNKYYVYWISQIGQKVRLHTHDDRVGKILGLDEHGYLKVELEDHEGVSETLILFDQDYSFDVRNRIINPKKSLSPNHSETKIEF